MTQKLDIDNLARERISSDLSTNFFVEAGAGSGKTTQLVARMTAMVKSGIDVRKICAITFTKAAAREFYKRFQESLSKTIEETSDETERIRCTEALNNIDLCFMGTIDSFSHLILHEHPIEGRIPSNSSVHENEEMSKVYMREYARLVNGEYDDDLLDKYKTFCKFQEKPDQVFKECIMGFITTRNSELVKAPSEGIDFSDSLRNKRAAFLQAIDCLMKHEDLWGTIKKCEESNSILKTRISTLKNEWNNIPQIIYILKTLSKEFRLYVNDPAEIGILSTELFTPQDSRGKFSHFKLDIEGSELFHELKEMQYNATVDFLSSAAERIADKLRLNGELSYFDYKLYLRDMLCRDAENGGQLIRHIYDRHSYFLIDEFQDTDPMQAEIFFYLSAEEPVSDWRECKPRPGSMFIVGDPKQSIYRFRSADVAAFKDVRQLFVNGVGEVLNLTRNYRSTVHLKEWFNRRFSEIMPEDTTQQSKFLSIPVEGNDEKNLFTGVWSYNVEIKGNSLRNGEERTADIIETLVGNPDFLIKDKPETEARMLRYSDCMLIVRSKDTAIKYLREFRGRSIPSKVEAKINFSDCPALTAMSKIMNVLASPDDPVSVYAALTSEVFGISEGEIADLVNKGIYLELRNADKVKTEGSEQLSSAFSVLKKLLSRSGYLSPAAIFCKSMDELRVLEKTGTDNLEYLFYAIELLRTAETNKNISSVREGCNFISSLIEGNATERCLSLMRNEDCVHIANLHKVKGLEAPVVILAHPYRKDPDDPTDRTEHTTQGSKHWIFSVTSSSFPKYTYAETNIFDPKKENEVRSIEAEDVRLLYVAATRAKNALIISQAVKDDGTIANKNPWDPIIRDVDGEFFRCVKTDNKAAAKKRTQKDASDLYEQAANNDIFTDPASEKPSYSISLPSQIKLNKVTSESEETADVSYKGNAALVGTMVHRLMEYIVSAKKISSEGKLISDILKSYDADEEYSKLLKKVYDKITNGGFPQKNGMPEDILEELTNAEEVKCEVPFCHKVTENDGSISIWNGVIDLLYKKDGKWRIVDYKTNAEAEELDYKYSEQLSAYKKAFKTITGEEAETFIYHIDV